MDYTPLDYISEMNAHYYRANAYHTVRDPDSDATSGNHHVINATHYLIMRKISPMSLMIVTPEPFIESTRTPEGWFNRHPTKVNDIEKHDDNIGIITISNLFGLSYAKEIYNYGSRWRYPKLFGKLPLPMKWYYDNLNGTKLDFNLWHKRFFWTVAVYKAGAGEKLNIIDKLSYCFYLLDDVYLKKDRTAVSGTILKWLANDVMKGKSWLIDKCIAKFEKHIEEVYPDKMGEVFAIYHGTEHPFAKIMKNRL